VAGPANSHSVGNQIAAPATDRKRQGAQESQENKRHYVRNFWSETIHHRPKHLAHEDVRM